MPEDKKVTSAKAVTPAKTATATTTVKKKNKHLVIYNGAGVWKDSKGLLWGTSKSPEIKDKREYASVMDSKEFLKNRTDIDFMINYGRMEITTLGEDVEKETIDAD